MGDARCPGPTPRTYGSCCGSLLPDCTQSWFSAVTSGRSQSSRPFVNVSPQTNLALGPLLGSAEEISDEVQEGEGETWGQGKDLWAHAISFKKDSNYQLNMGVKNHHLDENRTDTTWSRDRKEKGVR